MTTDRKIADDRAINLLFLGEDTPEDEYHEPIHCTCGRFVKRETYSSSGMEPTGVYYISWHCSKCGDVTISEDGFL